MMPLRWAARVLSSASSKTRVESKHDRIRPKRTPLGTVFGPLGPVDVVGSDHGADRRLFLP